MLAILFSSAAIAAFSQTSLNLDSIDESIELQSLILTESAPNVLNSRSSVQLSQTLGSGELKRAACCNLSESFETNPSVDVSYSDAATGAKQIKLLGLSGTYVQMLAENVPTLRGIAAPYGLSYTPGAWLESIQISKGTSSVLNGYEALAGQINTVYLHPDKEKPLGVNLYFNDALRFEANANASVAVNKNLSTTLLAHASSDTREWDMNDDGFLDMPKTQQFNVLNKWSYRRGDYMSHYKLRYLHENRRGGQVEDIENPYRIGIYTNRLEFSAHNGIILNNEKDRSIGLIVSGSQHEQDARFGASRYDAAQTNVYGNLIFATNFNKWNKISTGASFNLDRYDEFFFQHPTQSDDTRMESVGGIFAEYSLNLKDKVIFLFGLRDDYSSVYGNFLTPRLHTKLNFSKRFYARASVGKGYRSPNVLAENSYLLASSRQLIIASDLKQEEAWNYGVNATWHIPVYKNRELTLQGEFYRTDFVNQAVSDLDSDPHAATIANLDGQSYANSFQLEASYEILRGWTVTAAHRIINAKTTIGGKLREKPLTNRYKSLLTTSYQTRLKKWQFDFTTQINGGSRLPDPDLQNPLWDKEFSSFVVLNAQITRNFRAWSIYVGGENLTGYKQKRPIIDAANPTGTNFDASMVYAPLEGQRFYAGLRWNLHKYEAKK
ncbi:MAG: TonB-dependent receptor plug domain-containing protein [Prevotellaceae bacterium]|jgi:outer membrane receptor for ferrienterochelin and colicin|nr:TonB-dependent receptor plug domain-containing protein [Prevotellaceae bacterium]